MKILIDNGHGIDTKGKRSPDGQLLEYAQNRLLAGRIVSALLVPEENDISLPERCRRVNEWCRQLGKNNVLLISIHCNAAGRGDRWLSARGWCAYTTRGATRADALATSLYTAAQATASAPTTLTPPRPRERLLPPPPHPGSGSPCGKSLHGQPLRLRLPPQRRRQAGSRRPPCRRHLCL